MSPTTLTKEPRFLYDSAFAPIRGATRQQRLESSSGKQPDDYDGTRRRLLHGRAQLLERLAFREGDVWIDLGGGTGANLELLGDRIRSFKTVYLVDLAPSLLGLAQQRIARHGWTNVVALQQDATRLPLRLEDADVVTFSYSLTMIPDWYAALENAWRLLKPNGQLGVVDFYVSRKHPKPGFRRHDAWTRWFWPWWFAGDNVFLNPDHVPYLHQLFEPIFFAEHRASLNNVPFAKAPYYLFIGRK